MLQGNAKKKEAKAKHQNQVPSVSFLPQNLSRTVHYIEGLLSPVNVHRTRIATEEALDWIDEQVILHD
jgi:hypothetical protein